MSAEDNKKKENSEVAKDKPEGDKKDEKTDKESGGGAALTESDIALFKRYGKGPYTD